MPRAGRTARLTTVALGAVLLAAAAPIVHAEPATSLVVTMSPDEPSYLDHIDFTATPSPAQTSGQVSFYDAAGDGSQALATSQIVNGAATANIGAPVFGAPGSHGIYAVFSGGEGGPITSPTKNFDVGGAVTEVLVSGPSSPPEAHQGFSLAARLSSDYTQNSGGTLSFFHTGDSSPICTGDVGPFWIDTTGPLDCDVGDWPAGAQSFTVEYSGNAYHAPSTGTITVDVLPDVVHAAAFIQYLAFYPVKDSYRDTVLISAERYESITPTLRIYAPSGSLIKTVAFAKGTTPFGYAWDGRTSTGGLRPEGKYKVALTLVDDFGTTAVASAFVTLSHKKLIWHTKTIERLGKSAEDAGGHQGTAFIFADASYIKIIPSTGNGQAEWDFTIPSAVAYKSLTFKAYAKHQRTTGDTTFLGLENFTVPGCPTLIASLPPPECFGGKRPLGNPSGTTAWFSSASVLSGYRYGRLVRGMVWGTKKVTYVFKVQLVVKYATLGY